MLFRSSVTTRSRLAQGGSSDGNESGDPLPVTVTLLRRPFCKLEFRTNYSLFYTSASYCLLESQSFTMAKDTSEKKHKKSKNVTEEVGDDVDMGDAEVAKVSPISSLAHN